MHFHSKIPFFFVFTVYPSLSFSKQQNRINTLSPFNENEHTVQSHVKNLSNVKKKIEITHAKNRALKFPFMNIVKPY